MLPQSMNMDKHKFRLRFVSGEEKNLLLENLSIMLGSGMTVTSALAAIRVEAKSRNMRKILDEIISDTSAGLFVWKALDKASIFPPYVISLVRTGEESGNLAENLHIISVQQAKERVFSSKVRSAMLYPAIIFTVSIAVAVGVSWFVLPKLSGVFESMSVELPPLTRAMIGIGDFLGAYGQYVVPGALVLIGLIGFFLFGLRSTRHIGQGLLLGLPGIGRLMVEVELARSFYVLGTLIEAGLPIVRTLESLEESANLRKYEIFFGKMKGNIAQGYSFQKSFAEIKNTNKLVSRSIQQMIASAEQSGRLGKTFLKIADSYDIKTEDTTKNLITLLEPVLLIVVWVVVALIALSVVMPIYSLVSNVGNSSY